MNTLAEVIQRQKRGGVGAGSALASVLVKKHLKR